MTDLTERLKRATGPDREIDLAIELALNPDGDIAKLQQYRRGMDQKEGMQWDIGRGSLSSGSVLYAKWTDDGRCPYNGGYPLPRYTGSVDAALTLVPEGYFLTLQGGKAVGDYPAYCHAELECGPDTLGRDMAEGEPHQYRHYNAPTMPLAICIVAIQARATGGEDA